jgi:hypothetical protein
MYFDTPLKTSRVDLTTQSSPRHLARIENFAPPLLKERILFGNEKREMEGTEDTTMGVQIEEDMNAIRVMQIVMQEL